MTHTVKGFAIVNKTEIDVFLKLSCFFDDPVDVGNLIEANFKWRLVQDLWIVNEAIVPLHPIVPSPYTLLSEIPEEPNIYQ